MAGERNMMTSQFGSTAVPRSIGLSGVGTSMINNTSVNSRPPVVSGSQQPFISGYGNNQPLHPHMQFMPQQGMYGLGPRLPLSAIHPSSASANAMFNAAANSQPALGHPMLRPASGTKPGLG